MSHHPVIIWIGASDEEKSAKTPIINARIKQFETEQGRPATSTEILGIFGEVIEPDADKRKFISGRAPTQMPPLRDE